MNKTYQILTLGGVSYIAASFLLLAASGAAYAGEPGADSQPRSTQPTLRDGGMALGEGANTASYIHKPKSMNSNLHHIGKPDVAFRLERRGDNIRASDAVSLIIPKGWSIAAKKSVDTDQPVSWDGGVPWVKALNSVAFQSSFGVDLDWDRKHAIIRPLVESEGSSAPVQYALYKTNQDADADGNIVLPNTNAAEPRTNEEFMNQPVQCDVRGATLPVIMQEVLPQGWVVELVGIVDKFKSRRFDYTTPAKQSRGRAMNELAKNMNVVVTPYLHLKKVIISEATQ